MPRSKPHNVEEAAQKRVAQDVERLIDAIALSEGPSPEAGSVSDAKLLQQWGQRDPQIQDPDQLMQMLMTTGIPPEMLDPNSPQALAFIKSVGEMSPQYVAEWTNILAGPVDQRMAEMVAPLIEFPLRLAMRHQYEDDPKADVAFCNRLNARWQREMEQRLMGAPSAEPMPQAPEPVEMGGY